MAIARAQYSWAVSSVWHQNEPESSTYLEHAPGQQLRLLPVRGIGQSCIEHTSDLGVTPVHMGCSGCLFLRHDEQAGCHVSPGTSKPDRGGHWNGLLTHTGGWDGLDIEQTCCAAIMLCCTHWLTGGSPPTLTTP